MILFLAKPFRVISNVTDYAYWVKEVEVNNKGKIENYIIDNKAWSPNRFRGETPNIYAVTTLNSSSSQRFLDELYMTEEDLENCLYRVRDIIKEIENEKEQR